MSPWEKEHTQSETQTFVLLDFILHFYIILVIHKSCTVECSLIRMGEAWVSGDP